MSEGLIHIGELKMGIKEMEVAANSDLFQLEVMEENQDDSIFPAKHPLPKSEAEDAPAEGQRPVGCVQEGCLKAEHSPGLQLRRQEEPNLHDCKS